MDQEKYFRRRQYVLGPEADGYPGWETYETGAAYRVCVHPDLPVVQVQESGKRLTLLGYIIHPERTAIPEEETLQNILTSVRGVDDVPPWIERLTGRFALIFSVGRNLWIFHDPAGLRQVNYCHDAAGRIWGASQAETLAEKFGFEYDTEAMSYRSLGVFQARKTEFWMLNDRTPYREVRHLLPNHYLDVQSGRVYRYWPRAGSVPRVPLGESLEACGALLRSSIEEASRRFRLAMACSAGIDSRKTLAATRSVWRDIEYFSHAPKPGGLNVSDVQVPARLLARLGLHHEQLPWRAMSPEFRRLFERSATWAREEKGHVAYTIYSHFGPDATVLNSNVSEVAQNIYWLPRSELTGRGLAILCGLNHPFAINELQRWLDGAKEACEEAGLNVLSLFFLEQRMGRWCAAAFNEYDIAFETFNPYNNRHLHRWMLGVDERLRRDRRWDVSIRQIKQLWPEVLKEPINPQDAGWPKVQQSVRRFFIHKAITPWCPIYQYLRFVKKRRRFEAMRH